MNAPITLEMRAKWADQAISAFRQSAGENVNLDSTVCELLSSIAIWCDLRRLSFHHELGRGIHHYRIVTWNTGTQMNGISTGGKQ